MPRHVDRPVQAGSFSRHCWAAILQGARRYLSAPFMDTKWNKKYLDEKPFNTLNRMPRGERSSSSFNHTQTWARSLFEFDIRGWRLVELWGFHKLLPWSLERITNLLSCQKASLLFQTCCPKTPLRLSITWWKTIKASYKDSHNC